VTLVIPSNASEYLGVPPFARIAFHSFFVWRGDFFEKVLAMELRARNSFRASIVLYNNIV